MTDTVQASRPVVLPAQAWLESQQLAFGLALLAIFESSNRRREDVLGRVGGEFTKLNLGEKLALSERSRYQNTLLQLPPAVLQSLSAVKLERLGEWRPHAEVWREALATLKSE